MKKSYFLMLMALVLFLVSCRTEDASSDSFSSETQKEKAKVYLMKDVPAFKNFLETKINSSNYFSKSNSYAALLFDNQPVDVVKKGNKTSYSTFTKKDDTVYEILVYTIGEKDSFFIAQYISNTPIPYLDLTTFSGTVHYKSYNGELISSLSFENGIAKTAPKNAAKTAIGCYTVITTPVSCIEGLHFPGKPCAYAGTINAAYYDTQIINSCFQDEFYNEIGNGGSYGPDGGAGSNPAYSLPAPSAINYMLTQIGMQSLNTQQFSYLQNHLMEADNLRAYFLANQNVDTANFMYFGINFLMQNPTTTWEQFYNQYILPHINIDSSLNNSKIQCVLNKISGDTNQNDNVITLPLNSSNDNFIQKMLRSFNGVTTPNIAFHISPNLSNNDWGQTTGNNLNNYDIFINNSVENGSNLMKILTISHELIHAFMFYSLHSAGVISFDAEGNPLSQVNCYPNINYTGLVNFNNLTTGERFIALFCLMNQNGTLTPQWSHDIFNSPSINANIYRQEIENYFLNSYDWDNENSIFKTEAINTFGNNWKQELSKAISWIGLEQTQGYASYMNSYSTAPTKFNYINAIRSKIQTANSNCQ